MTFIETKFCDADVICPDCDGRGWKPCEVRGEPTSRDCIRCGGTGKRAGEKPCGQALTRAELRTRDGAVEQVIYFCTGHGTRKRLHGPETIDAQPEASAAETPQLA